MLKYPCQECGLLVQRTKSQMKGNVFCSHSCAAIYNNTKHKKNEEHPLWKGGKLTYRRRAFRHYLEGCSNPLCEITKAGVPIPHVMLEVDHKDGNRDNNALDNLQILCAWCHLQKTRASSKPHKMPTRIEWPPLSKLLDMVKAKGFAATGAELGVSDNAIRKHFRKHRVVSAYSPFQSKLDT